MTPVDKCPMNASEFERASKRKNCTGHTRYLCAPNKYLSNLIEFCTDRKRALYGKGMKIISVMNINYLLNVNNEVLNILLQGKRCFDCLFFISKNGYE